MCKQHGKHIELCMKNLKFNCFIDSIRNIISNKIHIYNMYQYDDYKITLKLVRKKNVVKVKNEGRIERRDMTNLALFRDIEINGDEIYGSILIEIKYNETNFETYTNPMNIKYTEALLDFMKKCLQQEENKKYNFRLSGFNSTHVIKSILFLKNEMSQAFYSFY